MKSFVVEQALLRCNHKTGTVSIQASQSFVFIKGQKVLVEPDTLHRPISLCNNVGINIKPCTSTVTVSDGYSPFIRIGGRRVCLDTITGLTDGTVPGTVHYSVVNPGQSFVREDT
ncbi:MAG: hypothetical protein JW795_18165 [Chitinivibrionales bacterium]|nr:hypothetical protein [Chitinivibrionales bacterium]